MNTTTRLALAAFATAVLPAPLAVLHAADRPNTPAPPPAVKYTAAAADSLDARFENPPPSARPWAYWFWINGNITREGITADLESMARVASSRC